MNEDGLNRPIPMGEVIGTRRQWKIEACPLPGALNERATMSTLRLAESAILLVNAANGRRLRAEADHEETHSGGG